MLSHPPGPPSRLLRALVCLGTLVLHAGDGSALPRVKVNQETAFVLVQQQPSIPELEASAPIAELNKALAATKAKLEELFRATEFAVAETQERQAAQALQIQVLQQEIEDLTAELWQASRRTAELQDLNERDAARITELTKAVEETAGEVVRMDEALAAQIQRNAQLDENLARANTARDTAVAEGQKFRVEMARRLQAATAAAEEANAELADLREQLGKAQTELATAKEERAQVETRAVELQEAAQRSAADAQRLKAELEAVKKQFDQAAGAAVRSERARQAADDEAEVLRAELITANADIERFRTAHAELEQQIASIHADSTSLTDMARQNLDMMEQKIRELNALVDLARPTASSPAPGSAVAIEDVGSTTTP